MRINANERHNGVNTTGCPLYDKNHPKTMLTPCYGHDSLLCQRINVMSASEKTSGISETTQSKAKFLPMKFVHEKNPTFRTYHADGQWIIVGAHSNLHINFYTEHPKMVSGVINAVDTNTGHFTGEAKLEGAPDADGECYLCTRDFQCNIVLPIQAAERLLQILPALIESAKQQQKFEQAYTDIKAKK